VIPKNNNKTIRYSDVDLDKILESYYFSLLGISQVGTNDPDYIFQVAESIPSLIQEIREYRKCQTQHTTREAKTQKDGGRRSYHFHTY